MAAEMAQLATTSVAVVGAVLGIINTWHGLDKSRMKLKVVPAHAIPLGVWMRGRGSVSRSRFKLLRSHDQ
jgi:hypothetical protein